MQFYIESHVIGLFLFYFSWVKESHVIGRFGLIGFWSDLGNPKIN